MSAPTLPMRHSCDSPGRMVMTGRTWPLTVRVVGASLLMGCGSRPSRPIWTSFSSITCWRMPRRAGMRRSMPSTMIAPESPLNTWRSTSGCQWGWYQYMPVGWSRGMRTT